MVRLYMLDILDRHCWSIAKSALWFMLRSCRNISLIALVMMLFACASNTNVADDQQRSVEELYGSAMDSLIKGNYSTAALRFDELELQHPYSIWATRAQLMAAFAYFKGDLYEDAVIAARRFVQLHPSAEEVPYAYYLIALSHYEQIVDVGRDQRATESALQSLEELIRRYPASEYAADARLKVDLAVDHLAGKEMEVGRYYLRRGNYLAAVNRFNQVVKKYQTTNHTPEALHRLAETYLALGLSEEARKSAAILGHNFPDNEWYSKSYALLGDPDVGATSANEPFFVRIFKEIF